jgi:predicted nucleotidyltransferase component of viral defense system
MIEFANLPATERETYFQETAERSRLPAHLVEKDFWVCYVLRLLFSNAEIARYLTFKGGTSLSKVYKAIDRFSEDIDFAVSRESLGFAAAAAPDALGISMEERRRRLTRLSASCLTWTTDSLFPAIRQALTNSLGTNRWSVDMVADENGNQQILFSYPRSALTLGNSYNPPRVRIELTARTDNHPSQPATVVPYVAENFPDAISDSSVNVEVLRIERTFWEKATILHQFHFQSDPGRVAPGFSRHYYDVYQLVERGYSESALKDVSLLSEVADHKNIFYRQQWARYDLARSPQTLELLPHSDIESTIADDYLAMKEMIFSSSPTFEEILSTVRDLKNRINVLQP